jgi:hypothetical protein
MAELELHFLDAIGFDLLVDRGEYDGHLTRLSLWAETNATREAAAAAAMRTNCGSGEESPATPAVAGRWADGCGRRGANGPIAAGAAGDNGGRRGRSKTVRRVLCSAGSWVGGRGPGGPPALTAAK